MVYFVFTYFCGAVYDDKILEKMKTAVIATLLISELTIAKWIEQGEKMNFDTFVNIAHRVSREIEHSDVNLNRMEKICEKMPFLQTDTIMGLLLFAQDKIILDKIENVQKNEKIVCEKLIYW